MAANQPSSGRLGNLQRYAFFVVSERVIHWLLLVEASMDPSPCISCDPWFTPVLWTTCEAGHDEERWRADPGGSRGGHHPEAWRPNPGRPHRRPGRGVRGEPRPDPTRPAGAGGSWGTFGL